LDDEPGEDSPYGDVDEVPEGTAVVVGLPEGNRSNEIYQGGDCGLDPEDARVGIDGNSYAEHEGD